MVSIPDDAVDLRGDGTAMLYLRRDLKEPTFYLRMTIPKAARKNPRNPYHVKKLGTADQKAAEAKAWELLAETKHRLKQGQSLHPRSFAAVAQEYVEDLERRTGVTKANGKPDVSRSNYARKEQCVRLYLTPVFGQKRIDEITDDDCEEWMEWRKAYNIDGPGADPDSKLIVYERGGKTLKRPRQSLGQIPAASTIEKDRVAFNELMEFARRKRYLTPSQKATIEKPEAETNRRPDFSKAEWLKLVQVMKARESGDEAKRVGPQTVKRRRQLHLFVWWLYLSGMRVSEAMSLRFRHVERVKEDGKEGLRINIPRQLPGLKSPKHARRVIPFRGINTVFARLSMLYAGEGFDELPQPDDFLWQSLDGHEDGLWWTGKPRVGSFDVGFTSLLKAANLLYDEYQRRCLTSIRHTYATRQIYRRVELLDLAKNMGTSMQMIHDHYDHAIHEASAGALSGD